MSKKFDRIERLRKFFFHGVLFWSILGAIADPHVKGLCVGIAFFCLGAQGVVSIIGLKMMGEE